MGYTVSAHPTLLQEGFYNELSHFIQQWRRSLNVDLKDKIDIDVLIKNISDDRFFVALKATRQDGSVPYGVDSCELAYSKFLMPEHKINDHEKFTWIANGLKYIADRIYLNTFGVYSLQHNMEVKYELCK